MLLQFWSISLVDVIVQISGIFLLRESKRLANNFLRSCLSRNHHMAAYPPVLLERKAEKLRASLRNRGAGGGHEYIRSVYDTGRKTR